MDGPLTYRKWLDAVRAGRSYVSDGRTHLMDFAVNGTPAGTAESEVKLSAPGRVKVAVTAAANLDAHPNDALRQLRYDEKPVLGHRARAHRQLTRGAGGGDRQR